MIKTSTTLITLQPPFFPRNQYTRRHHNQRAEPSGERSRNLHSLSPPRNRFRQPASPHSHARTPPSAHRRRRSKSNPIPSKSVCPICLGHHPHRVHECNGPKLWDGTPAFVSRNPEGRLVDHNGFTLCSDWQRPNGCNLSHKSAKHECSGCGNPKHGAQKCHKAQARPSANAL